MKLYTVQVAPNPTKVELYIEEMRAQGVDLDIERVTVKLMQGEQNQDAHLARSSFGTLPVLELSNGAYITESLPIIEYLEEIIQTSYRAKSMWGGDSLERACNRDLERIADTRILVQIARYVHATSSPIGLPVNKELAAAAFEQIPRGLAFFDDLLTDGRQFLAGDHPTVADCTMAAALQFARYGQYKIGSHFHRLLAWDQTFRARLSSQKVLLM